MTLAMSIIFCTPRGLSEPDVSSTVASAADATVSQLLERLTCRLLTIGLAEQNLIFDGAAGHKSIRRQVDSPPLFYTFPFGIFMRYLTLEIWRSLEI